jgi:hypothetical protein
LQHCNNNSAKKLGFDMKKGDLYGK